MENWVSYLLYFLAYATAIVAFSFNSIYWIRVLTIVSSFCYALYYFVFPKDPLWLDIIAESAFVILNIFMLFILWTKNRSKNMSKEEMEIHGGIFQSFSNFEFYKLIQAAKWINLEKGKQIVWKGEKVSFIYLIYSGKVRVEINKNRHIELTDGYFIGERSFSLNKKANADVFLVEDSRLLCWNQSKLKELFRRNPAMKDHFEKVITEDLAKKLNY